MALLKALFVFCTAQSALATFIPPDSDIRARDSFGDQVVNQTTCDGRTFTYERLAGYGFVSSNARDKFGDTLGGYGSSIAIDRKTWKKTSVGYTGILWTLPDRGWYCSLGLVLDIGVLTG